MFARWGGGASPPSAEHLSNSCNRFEMIRIPAVREECSADCDAEPKFHSIKMCARADKVSGSSLRIIEREEDGVCACVKVVEDTLSEQVLVEFRELSDAVVRIIPEPRERPEKRYDIRHNSFGCCPRMALLPSWEGATIRCAGIRI